MSTLTGHIMEGRRVLHVQLVTTRNIYSALFPGKKHRFQTSKPLHAVLLENLTSPSLGNTHNQKRVLSSNGRIRYLRG